MNTEQSQEMWQVEANGQIFDTNFEEMTTWIVDGSLLKIDRVRKGNLRWIEAGKVPSLMAVFNAKEAGEPAAPPVITLTHLGPTSSPAASTAGNSVNFAGNQVTSSFPASGTISDQVCSVHTDAPAVYLCETCSNLFCKACPNSYGGTVKICPFCGAMCSPIAKVEAVRAEAAVYHQDMSQGFGFGDFGRALAYPFKFKVSLIMGAVMYAFFSVGQGATGFGGMFMFGGALACMLVGNTLTFGILANTVENFAQGKIGLNFMPTFEDFSIWDDVVHPFFLSIGAYAVSFGPLIALGLLAFFMIVTPVAKQMNGLQSDAARTVSPELPYAANTMQQSDKVKELVNQAKEKQKRRLETMAESERAATDDDYEDSELPPSQTLRPKAFEEQEKWHNPSTVPTPAVTSGSSVTTDPDEEYFNRTNQMIQDSRKAQLEAAVGKTPDTQAQERREMVQTVLSYGVLFLLLGGICFLWGILYFPAACAVAGYTRSFAATLNPTVGFDTIKHLGVDYFKILLMALVLTVASGLVSSVLNTIFAAFDMPSVGNLPAKIIGSLFGFYISIVFSCVLGFALYKNADRLKLAR